MHKALTHMKINIDHDTQSIEMKADDHVPLSHPREFAFLFFFLFGFILPGGLEFREMQKPLYPEY